MLSADKAKEIHGVEGDGCWNPTVCHSRRSHARHRDRRNQTRNLKRAAGLVENIVVDVEELSEVFSAVLIVYRPAGEDTPIHAIARCKYMEGAKTAREGSTNPLHWYDAQSGYYLR
jgi:hypothetical protein